MQILVPWKPVVIVWVWGLLSAMIFFGFVASSVLQGKDPFASGALISQPPAVKAGATQGGSNKLSTPTRPLGLRISRTPEMLLLICLVRLFFKSSLGLPYLRFSPAFASA